MSKLLEGIKVLELAIYGFVPSAGAALSDWGAEVIKIEHPELGDPIRGLEAYGIKPGDGGVTALWEVLNRGKKSAAIDIRTEKGRELIMALVDQADIFLTNFMPDACKKLGINAEKILARNPRIIYGRGTGQGPIGPDANKGGFDAISYWSRSGAATASIPPDYGFPIMLPGPAFGDIQSGLNLAGGILGGLYQREKTGKGTIVDVSLLGSGLWAMQSSISGSYARGKDNIEQLDRSCPPNPLANMFKSGDERYFVLGMLEGDRYWPGLCEALGRDDLATDPRFANGGARAKNTRECVAELDNIFAEMTIEQINSALSTQEGPWSTVSFPRDTVSDEQALANGYIRFLDYNQDNDLPLVPAPIKFNNIDADLSRAPEHGEHTDEIVASLGHSEEELIQLKIDAVIL